MGGLLRPFGRRNPQSQLARITGATSDCCVVDRQNAHSLSSSSRVKLSLGRNSDVQLLLKRNHNVVHEVSNHVLCGNVVDFNPAGMRDRVAPTEFLVQDLVQAVGDYGCLPSYCENEVFLQMGEIVIESYRA